MRNSLALLGFCQHLVVYSLEDRRGYLAHKLGVGGIGGNFDILRTYYDIHFLVAAEALVYTRQFSTCHIHQTVVDHRSAENIALADKVSNESIGWFVVDIGWCTYLLVSLPRSSLRWCRSG